MQPAIDAIGALFKTGLARGGVFGATGVTVNGLTAITLARTSGDTDMITAGEIVIPAGWGGVWAFTALWGVPGLTGAGRCFLDLKNVTTGVIYREPVATTELGGVVAITVNVAAGATFSLSAFTSISVATNSFTVEAWRLS
jgi:hypothetical protein